MKPKPKIDIRLFAPVVILVTISLVTLLSINIAYFRSQLLALGVGIIAYFIFSKINIEFLKQLKLPIYIVSLVLLLIVLILGIESRGATRWVDIFGIRLQFSEILKPFLCISFAALIDDNKNLSFMAFLKILLYIASVVVLIAIQPDLGSGLLYASVAIFTMLIIGFPVIWFVISLIPILLASPVIWSLLHNYQKQRILTFLNSTSDPLGTSYNGIQAIIAVGSGTFLGKGFYQGSQSVLRFLPERHTDFIFATIAEGLGFVGAGFLMIMFFFLVYRIFILFNGNDNIFNKAFFASVFGFFLIQGFVNIAMNMGILPIVGITLPFVSFGGSSLLSNFIFLGIISSIHSKQQNEEVLEIR